MEIKRAIEILEESRAKGGVEVDLKVISDVKLEEGEKWFKEAEKLNTTGDYNRPAQIYYSLYKIAKSKDEKVKCGIGCVQVLINASNLDKAEELLGEMESEFKDEKYMGAIWEKRGWIADCRTNYDDEINYFKKAEEIYRENPESRNVEEGRNEDRVLTCEHFIGRALYFKGGEKDLDESLKFFNSNLEGYRKLKSDNGIAFNYSWIARVLIAQKKWKEAQEAIDSAEEFFDKASKINGKGIKTYTYRIKSELANAKGEKEEAAKYAVEALRLALPAGTYYNGVIEAVECLVRTLE